MSAHAIRPTVSKLDAQGPRRSDAWRPRSRVPVWWYWWYCDGMKTTIDKAGRVVIPAAIRERAGLTPGAELVVTVDELGIRLERVAAGPKLVRIGRRLVARPTASVDTRPVMDIAALVEEERNRGP